LENVKKNGRRVAVYKTGRNRNFKASVGKKKQQISRFTNSKNVPLKHHSHITQTSLKHPSNIPQTPLKHLSNTPQIPRKHP
jgi:hypothetical protein